MNLRAARAARDWSQSRLVREIELYAAHRGLTVASTASLSVYVSEWENGRRSVSEQYAKILRAILGMTNAELLGDEAETTPASPTADDYDVLMKSAARDAGDLLYLSHAMGEQAYVLLDAGRAALAVELVREAREASGPRLSPRLSAWLYAAEAEMCAHAGEADDCQRALDLAASALPVGDEARDPDMPSIFLNDSHLTRWRGNALALIGQDSAVLDLRAALESMDPTFLRAQAGVRCDLAQAHTFRGEYDEAARQIKEARRLANRTGSVRHRRRIDQLSQRI